MTMLRSLCLLLILANLGLLAAFSWFAPEPPPRAAYDGPGITLLREVDPGALGPAGPPADEAAVPVPLPEPIPIDAGGEPPPGEPAREPGLGGNAASPAGAGVTAALPADGRCISIGPFALPTEADAAMEALTAAGFAPSRSTRESEAWEGYWVYIEQIENQAAARGIAAELAENGITDTQVIASSENGPLLSIGVFSDLARAGAQAERVNRIGYEATIADSMRTTQTHWLDVVLTSEESIALDLLQEPGQISRLEQRDCADQNGD